MKLPDNPELKIMCYEFASLCRRIQDIEGAEFMLVALGELAYKVVELDKETDQELGDD